MTSFTDRIPVAHSLVRLAAVALIALCRALPANAGEAVAKMPREVNITTDSQLGWLPSAVQEQLARKTLADFLAALDGGRLADAYAFFNEDNKRAEPFADFFAAESQFNTRAGRVKERRIVKLTWTKNPASAPAPGVYAAFDLVSRFAETDRHCGYVVLHQASAGGAFHVARVENAYLDNATARSIAAQQSEAAVEEAWARVSANCPNYPRPQSQTLASGTNEASLQESATSSTGYRTVAAALADLKSRDGVRFTIENGWTIATDGASMTLWSFPPSGHPAYPAVVKRQVLRQGGLVSVKMGVLCEGSKAACDGLVRSFLQLNEAMEKNLSRRR